MSMQTAPIPARLLYSIPEARQLLGGIGHSLFYSMVKDGRVRLTKIGARSFVSDADLKCAAGIAPDAPAAA